MEIIFLLTYETAVRAQKDIAIAAKASGDDVARREAQAKINALQERYESISERAGLNTESKRMTVAGFRPVKTVEELKDGILRRTTTSDGVSVFVTRHLVERMKQREVTVEDAIDALTNPLSIGKIKVDEAGRPSRQYIGERVTVAVNPDNGNIVSTWPTSSKRAQKLKEARKKQ